MKPTCMYCGGENDLIWREIVGFDRRRAAGGTNAVTLRTETGQVACRSCIVSKLREAGAPAGAAEVLAGQGSMFDA